MNDSEHLAALESLAEAARTRRARSQRVRIASVRVSPGAYLAAASLLTFASALMIRSEQDLGALLALVVAWLVIPGLAFMDRISFDGECLTREGPVPFLMQLVSGVRQTLFVADVERVETSAVRTLRRGGRVRYRYRTQIIGRGVGIAFASGGRGYRQMVQLLFPLVRDEKSDLRTRELRDYLCEPKSLTSDVEALGLASRDVIENATEAKLAKAKSDAEATHVFTSANDLERATQLRLLGNRLRVAGRLSEAREAFRRALNVSPTDASLIFELARLLRSQASALGDARLLSRARAALRLAARRANDNAKLHSLIGETYLEFGEPARAQQSFNRALELDSGSFRSHLGLADVALRNGKLAHVIHQYRLASMAAPDKALNLYARREADYYARLNDDDDYLAAELRRINWLQRSVRLRRFAARFTNASILGALVGPYLDPAMGGIGWSLASASLITWLTTLFAAKFLADRGKPDLVD